MEESMDIVDMIMAYEGGDLDARGILRLFASLIQSGEAWSLQGHYGRTAAGLIEAGLISKEGKVDWPEVERRLAEAEDSED